MGAVFRHELSGCLTNLTTYVFGAFLLLFAGIYTMVYNLHASITNFEYVLGSMAFIYIVTVPILTMRVLSEERRQKTDQLLYSLPLTMTGVVLGKYAALLVVLAIPCAILCLYPLILSAFGAIYLPAAYSALFGFFFLGASLLSIGVFLSSLTESQAVAAGLCFVVMLLNYFIVSLADFVSTTAVASLIALTVTIVLVGVLVRFMTGSGTVALLCAALFEAVLVFFYSRGSSSFERLFPDILGKLSLFERFYGFVSGVFDITSLVYDVTIAAVCLFLAVQAMEKRRWSA